MEIKFSEEQIVGKLHLTWINLKILCMSFDNDIALSYVQKPGEVSVIINQPNLRRIRMQ